MSTKDSLGDRCKAYENAYRITFPRRVPLLIRCGGKAFHSLTKGCARPWDDRLCDAMDAAALALCNEIQGAQLAFVQSDEITVLVHGYRTITSEQWFSNELQKMVSVSASIATEAFNRAYRLGRPTLLPNGHCLDVANNGGFVRYWADGADAYVMPPVIECRAHFDSRAFLVPEDDVVNAFVWRQQDATRNSVQMLARSHFSHTQLHNKSQSAIHDMLHDIGVNWNDCATRHKRGRCVVRRDYLKDGAERHEWVVDNEIPVFTADRNYIQKHVDIHKDPEPCQST